MMLFLRRLLTALVLLAIFFVVFHTLAMMVGGGIAGARATAAQNVQSTDVRGGFNQGFATGMKAGLEFRRQYGQTVALASLALAAVCALWLTFGGVVSWCREPTPPPLPRSRYG